MMKLNDMEAFIYPMAAMLLVLCLVLLDELHEAESVAPALTCAAE